MSITALIMVTSTAEVTLLFITRFNSKVSMGMFPLHKIAGHVTFMTIHLGIQEVLTVQLLWSIFLSPSLLDFALPSREG